MTKEISDFIFHVNGKCLEVKLTHECITECSHQGSCDADVSRWVNKLRPYLDTLTPEFVVDCLTGYGAWDEDELKNHEANLERLLWVAACDCKECYSCETTIEAY